jgi:hypothetical protein
LPNGGCDKWVKILLKIVKSDEVSINVLNHLSRKFAK